MVNNTGRNYNKEQLFKVLIEAGILSLQSILSDDMPIKKIITYNVNGIRAASAKGFADWVQHSDPDIICLQETKAQPEQIPSHLFEEAGYSCYWFSALKKGYSGVGILSKKAPDKVVYGMGNLSYDLEGRLIRADFGDTTVISVYHPSGTTGEHRQAFKMKWLEDFHQFILPLRQERPNLIISGDYNICHTAIDIHDPIRNAQSSGFLPEERAWLTQFLASGFTDSFRFLHPDLLHQYSWWSYFAGARERNLGWRIDYHMTSQNLDDRITRSLILPEARHSDHCPVLLEIEMDA